MIFLHARVHLREVAQFAEMVMSSDERGFGCAVAVCPSCRARYVSVPQGGWQCRQVETAQDLVVQLLKTECPDHRHRLSVGA